MNKIKTLGVVVLVGAISGCSMGPIHIQPNEKGKYKIHMDTTYKPCKVGGKISHRLIKVECKWDVDI